MDRQVTQTGALIPNATLLGGEKAKLVALGYALQAILGTSSAVDGLAISATSPASLSVVIGPGSLMTYAAIDQNAFGDLGIDTTHFVTKQGLLQEPGATLTVTPPGASGYSQVFLVQAAYADQDGYTVLPYYNAANPAQPFEGPNNSGDPDLTLRASRCVVQLKPGAAAITGTQVAPPPDPGYVGLYLITIANGATKITSSNITLYPTAPFLDLKLPAVRAAIQAQGANYALDSGTGNAATITLPAFTPTTLGTGTPLRIQKGSAANTAAMTVAINGGSPIPVVTEAGVALSGGEWPAFAVRSLTFDGTALRLSGTGSTVASGALVAGQVSGLLPSGITGTATTAAITVSAGSAVDSTGAVFQKVPTALSWSVSNGNAINGYQGGTTLPNSASVHMFLIWGTAGFGAFASTGTTPALPTGYTYFRRIFSFKTDASGNPIAYIATEGAGGIVRCRLVAPAFDINNLPMTTSRQLVTLANVPTGFVFEVLSRMSVVGASGNPPATLHVAICSPDDTYSVLPSSGQPSFNPQPDYWINSTGGFTGGEYGYRPLLTNTLAQIAFWAGQAFTGLFGTVFGWDDARRS